MMIMSFAFHNLFISDYGGKITQQAAQPDCKARAEETEEKAANDYLLRQKLFIQSTMSSRSSGEIVSSIDRYSVGAPVPQCWKR